jgi:hypothetical protein
VHVKKALVHSLQRRHRTKSRGWPSANKKNAQVYEPRRKHTLSFTQAFEVRNRVHARATTESWILRSERDWLEPVLSRGGARNDESSEDAGGPEILGTANTDDYINRTPSRGYSSTALSLGTHLTSRPHTFALTYHNGALSVSSYHMASI